MNYLKWMIFLAVLWSLIACDQSYETAQKKASFTIDSINEQKLKKTNNKIIEIDEAIAIETSNKDSFAEETKALEEKVLELYNKRRETIERNDPLSSEDELWVEKISEEIKAQSKNLSENKLQIIIAQEEIIDLKSVKEIFITLKSHYTNKVYIETLKQTSDYAANNRKLLETIERVTETAQQEKLNIIKQQQELEDKKDQQLELQDTAWGDHKALLKLERRDYNLKKYTDDIQQIDAEFFN